jgi:hypothetical protein
LPFIEFYQKADSLPQGKADPEFKKKPEIAWQLINKTLDTGSQPGIVLIDAGYDNNTSFSQEVKKSQLKYIGGIAKSRLKVRIKKGGEVTEENRVNILAKSWRKGACTKNELQL